MATPALARFGSDELKKQFLVPTIAGDVVACIGVSEVGAGSDVASIKTTAVPKKGKIYMPASTFESPPLTQNLMLKSGLHLWRREMPFSHNFPPQF